MIVNSEQALERWLTRLCREVDFPLVRVQYSSAQKLLPSGKHQRFDRLQSGVCQPHFSADVAWQTSVHVQNKLLGHLQVFLPEHEAPGHGFLKACQFAEQISGMAADHMQILRQLDRRPHSAEAVVPGIDQGDLFRAVEETLSSLLKLSAFRGTAFFLLDPFAHSLHLKHYVHKDLPPIQTPERSLLEADFDRQAILEGVSICHRRKGQQQCSLPEKIHTGLCVPVANRSGLLGTLWAYDRRYREVETHERHLLQSLARQLGTLLDHALTSWNSSRHRQMKAELKIASATQPSQTIQQNTSDNRLKAYGQCLSQFDVGGDLCEVIPLTKDKIFVIVGDASGNSIPAAMVMTAVRGAVLALLSERNHSTNETAPTRHSDEAIQPNQVMSRLNKMLVQMTASHQFMSGVCGLFDLNKREFCFCNAGHPAPIHVSDEQVAYLPSHGLLLGIDEQMRYDQQTISYRADDLFVFYSDGISEALSRSRRMFRQDGIAHAAIQHHTESPQQIVEAIWNRVLLHRDGSGDADDATLLAIKLK